MTLLTSVTAGVPKAARAQLAAPAAWPDPPSERGTPAPSADAGGCLAAGFLFGTRCRWTLAQLPRRFVRHTFGSPHRWSSMPSDRTVAGRYLITTPGSLFRRRMVQWH